LAIKKVGFVLLFFDITSCKFVSMNKLLLIYLFFIFISCENRADFYINNDQIKVFYENQNDSVLAQDLMNYWIDNKLVGSSFQNIRLSSENDSLYKLQLIFTDTTHYKSQLSFLDLKNLYQLENDLNQTIFINNQLKISLCDNSFNEIMSLD
tara:strand:- start:431 stop:886 length:456 start_codon:yes stop_codon:yes gene_type:complete